MYEFQVGTRWLELLFSVLLRNSSGFGPTRRCAKSTRFRKGGTTLAKVPKLLANLCRETATDVSGQGGRV